MKELHEFTLRYYELHKVLLVAESIEEAEKQARVIVASKANGSRLLDIYKGQPPEAV